MKDENYEISVSDDFELVRSRLMYMTMLAHQSVLFDKIRKKIEQEEGGKLERIADLIVEASRNRK